MANTFLHAQGINVGKSLVEKDMAGHRAAHPGQGRKHGAARSSCRSTPSWRSISQANAPSHAYGVDAIPADGMILDVGSQSIERIKGAIDDAPTLVWNGPFGAFEMPPFERATVEVARYAAARTKAGKLSLSGRRRRHRRGAEYRGRRRPFHLCVHSRRRLPGVDGRQGLAGVEVLRQK